jgi:hypothetical protein
VGSGFHDIRSEKLNDLSTESPALIAVRLPACRRAGRQSAAVVVLASSGVGTRRYPMSRANPAAAAETFVRAERGLARGGRLRARGPLVSTEATVPDVPSAMRRMPKRTAIVAGAAALLAVAMGAGTYLLLPDKPAGHRVASLRVANGAVVAAPAASSASTAMSTPASGPPSESALAPASTGPGNGAAPPPSTVAALAAAGAPAPSVPSATAPGLPAAPAGRAERSAAAELPLDRLRRRLGEVLGSRGRLAAEAGGELRIVGTAAVRPAAAGSASSASAQPPAGAGAGAARR